MPGGIVSPNVATMGLLLTGFSSIRCFAAIRIGGKSDNDTAAIVLTPILLVLAPFREFSFPWSLPGRVFTSVRVITHRRYGGSDDDINHESAPPDHDIGPCADNLRDFPNNPNQDNRVGKLKYQNPNIKQGLQPIYKYISIPKSANLFEMQRTKNFTAGI